MAIPWASRVGFSGRFGVKHWPIIIFCRLLAAEFGEPNRLQKRQKTSLDGKSD
jgi:hypothetical protein